MKHQNRALMIAVLAAGLTACSDENPWATADGEGKLTVSVTTDTDITVGVPRKAVPGTRAAGTDTNAPEASAFSIKLEKSDGSYSKQWDKLADFNNESSIPTGIYTLTAYYGEMEAQGYDSPYYAGTQEVSVLEARETVAELTASLANSMVTVNYTETFKKYFADYTATLQSSGHAPVELDNSRQGEAVYVAPGTVDLSVAITKPNGQSVTIQPASFQAVAKHHYNITLDVNNGQIGDAQFVVYFDDTLTQEDVTIDLTEELFTAPAPTVNASGFTSGVTMELLSLTNPETPIKYTIIGHGGLKEVTLTVASSDYTPAFGKEINLIGATEAQQNLLAASGVKALGLFKNPDRMASIDITDFIGKLPAGDYTISVVAKDNLTRVSDIITLNITAIPLTLTATPKTGIFGTNTVDVTIAYNGADPAKDITFAALNRSGVYVNAPVVSVVEASRSRAIETKEYTVTIELPDTDRDEVPVKVYLKGEEKLQFNIPIETPTYSVTADALSRCIGLKIDGGEMTSDIVKALHVFISNGTNASITRDTENNIIYINNLDPASTYTVKHGFTSNANNATELGEVTTEAAADVPNGDFSSDEVSINITDINAGGPYRNTALTDYHNTTSIIRSTPIDWATLNSLTCYQGTSSKNTWFMVPSSYVENGEVVIRTVGYSHSASEPERTGNTLNTTYYCTNSPAESDLNKKAGELFLGSYYYDGSESRTDGISFYSRPSSMTFQYKYSPLNGETGIAKIEVIDASGTVIASAEKSLTESTSMTDASITLPSYAFGSKAASLRIIFKSSTAANLGINIPSGNALDDGCSTINRTVAANASKAVAVGSVLTVDNVKLVYGSSSSFKAARKKAVRKSSKRR